MTDTKTDPNLKGQAINDADVLNEKFNDILTPGCEIELTPEEADRAGAFVETALSEQDAKDSTADLADLMDGGGDGIAESSAQVETESYELHLKRLTDLIERLRMSLQEENNHADPDAFRVTALNSELRQCEQELNALTTRHQHEMARIKRDYAVPGQVVQLTNAALTGSQNRKP